MHARTAEVELARSNTADVAKSMIGCPGADQIHYQERPLVAARGIVTATMIVAPFWALFVLVLYLIF
jgi:hypothetical protein